jgi:hypothetical protein
VFGRIDILLCCKFEGKCTASLPCERAGAHSKQPSSALSRNSQQPLPRATSSAINSRPSSSPRLTSSRPPCPSSAPNTRGTS